MKRIKNRPPDHGATLKTHGSSSSSTLQLRPKFSLEYLDRDFCLSCCTKDQKAALADRLHELSQLTWQQIMQADRHKQGCETIDRNAIKASIPACITEDVKILAFRFSGLAPMVGFRRNEVFFIVWLDRGFSLYNHG